MNRIKLVITLSLITLLVICGYQSTAQEQGCFPLNTTYPHVSTNWTWLDDATIVFEVSNFERPDSLVAREDIWYQYDFQSGSLTTLLVSPLNTFMNIPMTVADDLVGLAANETGTFMEIEVSPSQQALVYPRSTSSGEENSYWYLDVSTGMQVELNISRNAVLAAETIWASQAPRFVFQGNDIRNSEVFPTVYVSMEQNIPEITVLQDLQAFRSLGQYGQGFTVMGINHEGRYLIIDPILIDNRVQIFDWETQTWEVLAFKALGERRIVWTDTPNQFIALTDQGVIRYDIETEQTEIIKLPSQLGHIALSGSLSPTGEYLIGDWYQSNLEGSVARGIEVCILS
jgi:hypothetical protein